MPKVSVILCVYNGAQFLAEAIESVLKQTFTDFEFIILDDKSTDSSLHIISDFAHRDSRIKIIKNVQNIGLTKSLNIACRVANGQYLARIDADDVCLLERLVRQVAFLDANPNCALVGSWVEIIDEAGNILRTVKYPTGSKDLKKDLIKYNPFFHSSIIMSKDAFYSIGLYNEEFRFAQDYELYFRIAKKYDIANLPEVLISYRESKGTITSVKNRQQISCVIRAKYKAIRDRQYPIWSSVYLLRSCLAWLLPVQIKKGIKRLIHL
jgi:glycosyltransferase involved in cell wall biosynthesis